jgi:hypothetical protein
MLPISPRIQVQPDDIHRPLEFGSAGKREWRWFLSSRFELILVTRFPKFSPFYLIPKIRVILHQTSSARPKVRQGLLEDFRVLADIILVWICQWRVLSAIFKVEAEIKQSFPNIPV